METPTLGTFRVWPMYRANAMYDIVSRDSKTAVFQALDFFLEYNDGAKWLHSGSRFWVKDATGKSSKFTLMMDMDTEGEPVFTVNPVKEKNKRALNFSAPSAPPPPPKPRPIRPISDSDTCKRGHLWAEEARVNSQGRRYCRKCSNLANREAAKRRGKRKR